MTNQEPIGRLEADGTRSLSIAEYCALTSADKARWESQRPVKTFPPGYYLLIDGSYLKIDR